MTELRTLRADRFFNDPRISQARRLVAEALQEHSAALDGVHGADPALVEPYHKLIDSFNALRGGALYYPYVGSGLGHGPLVELCDGSVKYDMISGIGVHFLGHSHPLWVLAAFDAALSDTVMQGHLQQTAVTERLMSRLTALSGLDHCFLTSSGVMAIENALKMAFQRRHPADRLLAFDGCFCGRTLAASQITDRPQFREGMPTTLAVDYVPFMRGDDIQASIEATMTALERHLRRYPGRHAAMVMELVQGEGGFYPGAPPFFEAIMRRLQHEGIVVIVDEVQTFARTTALFAFQHFGLDPLVDIVTIGKLSLVCATLFRESLRPKPGLLSQTFTASTSALYGSLALLEEVTHNGYYGADGKIARQHAAFSAALEGLHNKYGDLIRGPYGIGSMIAFTVYEGDGAKTTAFVKRLFDNGVIAFVAGQNPMRVRFLLPSGSLSIDDVPKVVALVEKTLTSNP